MLCLSGFELYSRWVPLKRGKMEAKKGESPSKISSPLAPLGRPNIQATTDD